MYLGHIRCCVSLLLTSLISPSMYEMGSWSDAREVIACSMRNLESCSSRWQLAKQIAGWEKPEYPGWLQVVLGFCLKAFFS